MLCCSTRRRAVWRRRHHDDSGRIHRVTGQLLTFHCTLTSTDAVVTVKYDMSEWVGSFLTAHQHIIGHFSDMISVLYLYVRLIMTERAMFSAWVGEHIQPKMRCFHNVCFSFIGYRQRLKKAFRDTWITKNLVALFRRLGLLLSSSVLFQALGPYTHKTQYTHQLGQLSLASIRGRLIEYQLRLG